MQNQNRILNNIERAVINLCLASNFSFIVMAHLKGEIDVEILKKAIRIIKKRYYYLNVTIDLTEPVHFIFNEEIEIPLVIIQGKSEIDWLIEGQRELEAGFDLISGPFARAILIRSEKDNEKMSQLIICFNHCFADGVSGIQFLKQVINAYNRFSSGKIVSNDRNNIEQFPSLSAFPDDIFGFSGMLKTISFLYFYLRSTFFTSKKHLPPLQYLQPEDRRVRIFHKQLTVEQTSKLINNCKRNNTTVQGALCAAQLLILAQVIREATGVRIPKILSVSTINARNYSKINISDDQLGLWVGQVFTPMHIKPGTDLWDLAVKVKDVLTNELKSHKIFIPYKFLVHKVFKTPKEFLTYFETKVPYIETSNLGVLQIDFDEGPLYVENINFFGELSSVQASPWAITISATTFNNRLNLNFHLLEKYWNAKQAEDLMSNCINRLLC